MNAPVNATKPTMTPEAHEERPHVNPEAQPATTNELSEQELHHIAGGTPWYKNMGPGPVIIHN